LKCDICHEEEAFYKRTYEGVSLCRKCFVNNIEEKVRRTISKYDMLSPQGRVAVAVSGGKDSLTLLTIMNRIEREFPKIELAAITIDEGIGGYRDEAIEIAESYCKEVGVEHVVLSFKELFGHTLDSIVKSRRELTPCSYCGVLRRRAINEAAKTVKADVVATAHNLDDEVQTFMLNLFHGDVNRIARVKPVLNDFTGRFLRRVKPLCEVVEKEVALFAYLTGIRFQSMPCPYMSTSLRNDMRSILNRMEAKHSAGIKYTAYRSMEKIREMLEKSKVGVELSNCEFCGEPTVAKVCEVCNLLGEFKGGEATTGRCPNSCQYLHP